MQSRSRGSNVASKSGAIIAFVDERVRCGASDGWQFEDGHCLQLKDKRVLVLPWMHCWMMVNRRRGEDYIGVPYSGPLISVVVVTIYFIHLWKHCCYSYTDEDDCEWVGSTTMGGSDNCTQTILHEI